MKWTGFFLPAAAFLFLSGCGRSVEEDPSTELRRIPLDSTREIAAQMGVSADTEVTKDGNGSIRIDVRSPSTIKLCQVSGIDVENALLAYEAWVRTENFDGEVYLEMACDFAGKGEYYSRGLKDKLSGTCDWKKVRTVFRCEAGRNPGTVKLNIVTYGSGTAWIDDIRLSKSPLKQGRNGR